MLSFRISHIKNVKKIEEQISGSVSLDAQIGDEGKTNLGDMIEDQSTFTPDEFV